MTKLFGKMVTESRVDRHPDDRPRRKRRLPSAERRETILDAAAEVFAQVGYRAAKVSDVAARVGVTEPVVFQNFGSKAVLFAAVLERAAAEVRASLDHLAEGSASELLAHVLTGSAPMQRGQDGKHGQDGQDGKHEQDRQDGKHREDRERAEREEAATDSGGPVHTGAAYAVLFADATALTAEPELAGAAREAIRAVAGHLADVIQRAQADGDLSPDADPEAAAWLVLSVLSAHRLRAAVMPGELETAVTALALAALGCTPRDRLP
jgi:AcrR family transcriptional regulator